jgi:hypothetical protein
VSFDFFNDNFKNKSLKSKLGLLKKFFFHSLSSGEVALSIFGETTTGK